MPCTFVLNSERLLCCALCVAGRHSAQFTDDCRSTGAQGANESVQCGRGARCTSNGGAGLLVLALVGTKAGNIFRT